MLRTYYHASLFCIALFLCAKPAAAQVLSLQDALGTALSNYGSIKAREHYAAASSALVEQSRRDYLPNFNLAAQQDYGTINGQNGPLYGFGGLGVASSGLPLDEQNWNAAFGALYLANINWDFFSFGRIAGRIEAAKAAASRDQKDLEQERFQQQIKTAAAYLNLLAAQRITISQQRNLDRALVFRDNAIARAATGLVAGVDSSLANAEVSRARILLTQALDAEQERTAQLALAMGVAPAPFVLDTSFISKIPGAILNTGIPAPERHPLLEYYQSRIDWSQAQAKYYSRSFYPTVSLFSVIQARGSGFQAAYTQDQTAFSHDFFEGIKPTRGNYLLGVGISWNLTTILRAAPQISAQKFVTQALQEEYGLAAQQLSAQLALSETRIRNALDNYNEAPLQVRAANDAYLQKSALYKNGLTNMVDLTQALYTLNRAETDRDIAYSNVWQALLLKAAATGQLSIFMNEF